MSGIDWQNQKNFISETTENSKKKVDNFSTELINKAKFTEDQANKISKDTEKLKQENPTLVKWIDNFARKFCILKDSENYKQWLTPSKLAGWFYVVLNDFIKGNEKEDNTDRFNNPKNEFDLIANIRKQIVRRNLEFGVAEKTFDANWKTKIDIQRDAIIKIKPAYNKLLEKENLLIRSNFVENLKGV